MAKLRTDATEDIQRRVDARDPIELSLYDGCQVRSVDLSDVPFVRFARITKPTTLYMADGVSPSKGMFHLEQDQDSTQWLNSWSLFGASNLTIDFQGSLRHFLNQSVYGTNTRPDVPGIRIQSTTGVSFRNGGRNAMLIRVQKARRSTLSLFDAIDHDGPPHGHTDTENEMVQEIVTEHGALSNVAAPGASACRPSMLRTTKKIPPRIIYRDIRGTTTRRWKTHFHNRVEISDVHIRGVGDLAWPGFDMPPNLIGAGVFIERSSFGNFRYAVRTEAGHQYHGNELTLSDLTATDCQWMVSNSDRVCVNAFGTMVGQGLRKGFFSDPESVKGDWRPRVVEPQVQG